MTVRTGADMKLDEKSSNVGVYQLRQNKLLQLLPTPSRLGRLRSPFVAVEQGGNSAIRDRPGRLHMRRNRQESNDVDASRLPHEALKPFSVHA